MKKKTITGIILLMSVSLFGIIGLQLYWINHAVRVREADFDRQVNEALAAAAEKLEARETAQLVAQGMQLVSQQEEAKAKPELPVQVPVSKPRKKPKATTIARVKPASKSASAAMPQLPGAFTFYTDTLTLQPNPAAAILNRHLSEEKTAEGSWEKKIYFRQPQEQVLVEMIRCNPVVITRPDAAFTDSLLKNLERHRIALTTSGEQQIIHKLKPGQPTSALKENGQFRFRMQEKSDTAGGKKAIRRWVTIRQGAGADSLAAFQTFFGSTPPPLTPANQPESAPAVSQTKPDAKTRAQEQTTAQLPLQQVSVSQPRQVVAERGRQLHQVMERMLVEMLRKDTPVEERLTLAELDSALRLELQQRQVHLPYELYVVSNRNEAPLVTLASAKHTPPPADLGRAHYSAQLFPNSLRAGTDFLMVNFPTRNQYVFRSLWGLMALSGVFTLVILFTFSSTLFYIFRQKKLSEIKTDFINNMTHEFKTPIATISLAVNNINNPRVAADPERVRQYTGIISQENARMNEHVERVLQAALLDKKLEIQQADVHLHALVRQATDALRLQVESRGGRIFLNLSAENDLISGDAEHLLHVLLNLLDNANKYSPEAPEISVATHNAGGRLLLSVTDKGLGISREVQKRIFEKFYRKPTGNLHNVKGFGLGLSYVKAITEAHKGTVAVRSHEGRGAEFTLTFGTK